MPASSKRASPVIATRQRFFAVPEVPVLSVRRFILNSKPPSQLLAYIQTLLTMSTPVAIPRASSTDAAHSTSSSPSALYVPIHKRGGSHSRSPSPVPSPVKTRRGKTHKSSPSSASIQNKPTHIPNAHSSIPQLHHIPFVYSFTDLLSLSSIPVTLAPAQLESLHSVIAFCTRASESAGNDKSASSAAARRSRRTGRPRSKSTQLQQKVVSKTADVETRRARHGHASGTWGWHPYTSPTEEWKSQHQHQLEESWRHVPAVTVVA
ncbi:hypothetical protein PHLCEN_2v13715 [Hermanssonia centrifuga]|uniref:Uncharacterized protein n=1 Tax=Hermanssonia centrifuga TaxID=98765 RepID=A0A2R6NDI5_9APHY|nr:hypothetical protein PHLCEN_2v13715 [Hermanssonia centrifuga]